MSATMTIEGIDTAERAERNALRAEVEAVLPHLKHWPVAGWWFKGKPCVDVCPPCRLRRALEIDRMAEGRAPED